MRESQKVGIVRMAAIADFKKKHGDVIDVKITKKIEISKSFEVSGINSKGVVVKEKYYFKKNKSLWQRFCKFYMGK